MAPVVVGPWPATSLRIHLVGQPARRSGKHATVDDDAALHHGMVIVGLPFQSLT